MLKIRQIPTPVSIYRLSNALSNNIRMQKPLCCSILCNFSSRHLPELILLSRERSRGYSSVCCVVVSVVKLLLRCKTTTSRRYWQEQSQKAINSNLVAS